MRLSLAEKHNKIRKRASPSNKKSSIRAAGTYTTTFATTLISTGDWNAATASLTNPRTIAGALGAGMTAGLNTGISASTGVPVNNLSSTTRFLTSMAGEAAQFATHTVSNAIQGHGWSSFGRGFDDMGGLTFNLMNVSTIARLLGVDGDLANEMSLGLFELQITGSGVSSRFGTAGVDISAMMFDAAAWGLAALRERQATETAQQMAEGQLPENLVDELLFDENLLREILEEFFDLENMDLDEYQVFQQELRQFLEDFNPYLEHLIQNPDGTWSVNIRNPDGTLALPSDHLLMGGTPLREGTFTQTAWTDSYASGQPHMTLGGFWAADYAAAEGTPIFVSGVQTLFLSTSGDAFSWFRGDSEMNTFDMTRFGMSIEEERQGRGLGLMLTLYSGRSNVEHLFGHLNPGSSVEARLNTLIVAARAAGVSLIPLPPGTQIGEVGNTGFSTGPHLHHERRWRR